MTVTITPHEVPPITFTGDGGQKPPKLPGGALASPHPPEMEAFDPSQHQLRAKIDADFHEITSQLTDSAAQGDQIITDDKALKQQTN